MGRYGYGYGMPGPSRRPEVIWDARLDLLPLSTTANAAELRAALLARGLTLTRASAATVQTSASTVVTSGIGVDDPRVGDAGYGRGLVIEESRQNMVATSSGSVWSTTGTASYGASAVAGPDGSTGSVQSVLFPAENDGIWITGPGGVVSSTYTRQAWVKGTVGQTLSIRDASGNAGTAQHVMTGDWQRITITITQTAGSSSLFIRREVGDTATSALVWFRQLELGKFATEAIPTTGAAATRAADNLTLAPNVSRSGFLALEWKLVSKAATGSYSVNTVPLWTGPNGDYIGFHGVNRNVLLYLGGVVYSSAAGAISWAAGDVVEIFVSCGGGAAAVFKYRVNGGAVTTVVIASGGATPVLPTYASGGVLLQSGSASCWLQRVRAYAPGRRPAWAA